MIKNISNTNELKYNNRKFSKFYILLIILIFSAVSILSINRYWYGAGDHTIAIPFLKHSINNNLYPNDYLIAQKAYFYTYLWKVLGLFVKYFNISIPVLFFVFYCIFLYLTFLAVYLIAMVLFRKKEVAFLSLFLLLFSKTTLGDVSTLEGILYTRVAALPILLFAIYFFLNKKYWASFFLQGFAFLIHPLSATYIIAIILVFSVCNLKEIGIKKLITCFIILGITISPSIIWKIKCHPESLSLFYAAPKWIELQRLRSSRHIFPFSWHINKFISMLFIIIVFFISWKYKPKYYHQRFVAFLTFTIFAMWITGTIFTEIIPVSIIIQFQLFRSSRFIFYFAAIYYANYFFREIQHRKNISDNLSTAFMVLGLLIFAKYWQYAYIAFMALAFFLFWNNKKNYEGIKLPIFSVVLLITILILGTCKYHGLSIGNTQKKTYLDVQVWAKNNTNLKDVFIVLPMWGADKGFRVESERTIYGNYKDGTQALFDPSFGYEWFRRMKALGFKKGKGFKEFYNLKETDFVNLANEIKNGEHGAFLVTRKNHSLDFSISYKNKDYIIYKLIE